MSRVVDPQNSGLSVGSWLRLVLVLLTVTLILFVRKPDAFLNPQFWAEDGTIFFAQQYESGGSAILRPYAGYLHLLPRLVAWIADVVVPVSLVPVFYNYSALMVIMATVASIFSDRLKIKYQVLLAMSVVLVPHYSGEVFLNITNSQWYVAIMLVVLLLKDDPSDSYGNKSLQYLSDLTIILIGGLTGPFVILLFPFFVWKWLLGNSNYSTSALSLLSIVALIQVSCFILAAEPSKPISLSPDPYFMVLGYKMVGLLFLAPLVSLGFEHDSNSLTIVSALLSLIYLAAIPLALRAFLRERNRQAFLCLASSIVILLAAFYRVRDDPMSLFLYSNGSRYFFVPYVLTCWTVIIYFADKPFWRYGILTTILISSLSFGFQSQPFIDYQWSNYAPLIGHQDVRIPINPKGWELELKARPVEAK